MAAEWSRLTRHAKRAVVESQELAASLESSAVQPEHLLMTLLEDPSSAALLLLNLAEAPVEELRGVLEERIAGMAAGGTPGEKPAYSPAVRQIVQDAASASHEGPVGTERLAIAALEAPGPLSVRLQEAGIDTVDMRNLLEILGTHELSLRSGPPPGGARPPSAAAAPSSSAAADPPPGSPAAAASPTGGAMGRPGVAGAPVSPESGPPPPVQAGVAEPFRAIPTYSAVSRGSGAEANTHTVLALARLTIDLAGKAARAAREHGNTALADQLDRMREETNAQIQAAAPPSQLSMSGRSQRDS